MGLNPRRVALGVLQAPLVARAVRRLAKRDPGRPDLLAVLTYHRVDEPADDLYPGLISATPGAFATQVAWLARSYQLVSLGDVLARLDGGDALPPRSVLITFDDAYRDFASKAWPVLRANRAPAALFVPTAYPGDPTRAFWWDRLHRALTRSAGPEPVVTPMGDLALSTPDDRRVAFKRLRAELKSRPHEEAMDAVDAIVSALGGESRDGGAVLDWDELRAVAAEGVELGIHSRTHPLLDQLPVHALDGEIAGAWEDLQREVPGSAPAIAYPNGNHSPAVQAAARRAGMRAGFATRRGTNRLDRAEPLALRRINVGRATDPTVLAIQLHRWFGHWR
jgi:peptidoglycan/xylan/chitin deacetylase (PgdA/CDA1 family)